MQMRILLILMLLFPCVTHAQDVGESTGYPIPRFVSLNGDQVHSRMGPGTRFPIKWTYQRKNLPVEIIEEFDNWRKIRDIEGEEGWVHQSLLSGKRYAIQNTTNDAVIHRRPEDTSRQVAIIESGAVILLDSCENDWCRISSSGLRGWIPAVSLWGVYDGEQIE